MNKFYRIVHTNGSEASYAHTLEEALTHAQQHSIIEYESVSPAKDNSYCFLDKEVEQLQFGGQVFKKVRKVR